MKIILEGPDNSGKSTLIRYLSHALGTSVVVSGGPSKYAGEVNERSMAFNERTETELYDRHPCISQNIYQEALLLDGERVKQHTIDDFYAQEPFIIYCRNIKGADGHVLSDHSSAEYFQQVETNFDRVRSLYDAWALDHAHYVYRIGDSMADVLLTLRAHIGADQNFTPWDDVLEFHSKFQQSYEDKPRQLPAALQSFRDKFAMEEFREYNDHVLLGERVLQYPDDAAMAFHLEQQFDALIDLTYVVLGTAHLQGFSFPEGWRRVHEANMSKVIAVKDGVETTNVIDSGRDKRFDIVKPKGWEPPSHADLVEDHAHRKVKEYVTAPEVFRTHSG